MSYGFFSPKVGQRVELSPHFDLWMQGARFGSISAVLKHGKVRVKLDHPAVRTQHTFKVADLKLL